MSSEKPLAGQLRELWARFDAQEITRAFAATEQERLLDIYRQIWVGALVLEGETDLTHSILTELAKRQGTSDLDSVRRRFQQAALSLKAAWEAEVHAGQVAQVERFYERSEL